MDCHLHLLPPQRLPVRSLGLDAHTHHGCTSFRVGVAVTSAGVSGNTKQDQNPESLVLCHVSALVDRIDPSVLTMVIS